MNKRNQQQIKQLNRVNFIITLLLMLFFAGWLMMIIGAGWFIYTIINIAIYSGEQKTIIYPMILLVLGFLFAGVKSRTSQTGTLAHYQSLRNLKKINSEQITLLKK